MDQIAIRSAFLKSRIQHLLTRIIRSKIGIAPDVIFKDDISIVPTGVGYEINFSTSIIISKDDIDKLLKKG